MSKIDELQANRIALKFELNSFYGQSDFLENTWKEYLNTKQQICDLRKLNDRRNKIEKICSKLEMK